MKKPDLKKGCESFLGWKGWKATARFCVRGWNTAASFCLKCWNSMLHWPDWRILFGLPLNLLLVLSTGIYMILRGTREIKKLQEKNNGK